MTFASVVPETRSQLPRDAYTYSIPDDLAELVLPGVRVEIPFGKRTILGYVVDRSEETEFAEVRAIDGVIDEPRLILDHHIALARQIADRYCAPLGEVLRAMLPKGVRTRPSRRSGPRSVSRAVAEADVAGPAESPPTLNDAQRAAVVPLLEAIATRTHRRVLLHGVTGSGKTEVYLAGIDAALAAGRGAIVLVPEIALTPQMIRRFAVRFPGQIAVVHSALTDAERAAEWRRIRNGEHSVVIGSRSAVFAPVVDLGIVVVDEEDAPAYKQDRVPRYHAVDVALMLGALCKAPVVMGSATPRVESFFRAHTGDLELVTLPERVSGRPLPPIEVVDLRDELQAGNTNALSLTLDRAMQECHADGGQSILFLNRRGTSTVVLCRTCGEALMCRNCSVSLVHHVDRASCDCHYCGLSIPLPAACPTCGSRTIRALGMGTERLEREVRERFPALRLIRMDRDTTRSRDAYFDIYDRFRRHEADCLIGTQMVAKGWDLGNVRLVGIVNADTSLHFPDYRSGELTFSLLTQVAGRAGRGDEPARVVLQTYSPGHYAVRHAITHDYLGFARDEIRVRKALRFPPYARLCVCTFAHKDDREAEIVVRREARRVSDTLGTGA
ncbi:MAG: primosomal protein N', partial [Candidatus Dormiibacterota bacterium]